MSGAESPQSAERSFPRSRSAHDYGSSDHGPGLLGHFTLKFASSLHAATTHHGTGATPQVLSDAVKNIWMDENLARYFFNKEGDSVVPHEGAKRVKKELQRLLKEEGFDACYFFMYPYFRRQTESSSTKARSPSDTMKGPPHYPSLKFMQEPTIEDLVYIYTRSLSLLRGWWRREYNKPMVCLVPGYEIKLLESEKGLPEKGWVPVADVLKMLRSQLEEENKVTPSVNCFIDGKWHSLLSFLTYGKDDAVMSVYVALLQRMNLVTSIQFLEADHAATANTQQEWCRAVIHNDDLVTTYVYFDEQLPYRERECDPIYFGLNRSQLMAEYHVQAPKPEYGIFFTESGVHRICEEVYNHKCNATSSAVESVRGVAMPSAHFSAAALKANNLEDPVFLEVSAKVSPFTKELPQSHLNEDGVTTEPFVLLADMKVAMAAAPNLYQEDCDRDDPMLNGIIMSELNTHWSPASPLKQQSDARSHFPTPKNLWTSGFLVRKIHQSKASKDETGARRTTQPNFPGDIRQLLETIPLSLASIEASFRRNLDSKGQSFMNTFSESLLLGTAPGAPRFDMNNATPQEVEQVKMFFWKNLRNWVPHVEGGCSVPAYFILMLPPTAIAFAGRRQYQDTFFAKLGSEETCMAEVGDRMMHTEVQVICRKEDVSVWFTPSPSVKGMKKRVFSPDILAMHPTYQFQGRESLFGRRAVKIEEATGMEPKSRTPLWASEYFPCEDGKLTKLSQPGTTILMADVCSVHCAWPATFIVDWLLFPPFEMCITLYGVSSSNLCDGAREEELNCIKADLRTLLLASLSSRNERQWLEFVGDALYDFHCVYSIDLRGDTDQKVVGRKRHYYKKFMENRYQSQFLPILLKEYLRSYEKTEVRHESKKYSDMIESFFGAVAVALWVRPLVRILATQQTGVGSDESFFPDSLPDFDLLMRCAATLSSILHIDFSPQ